MRRAGIKGGWAGQEHVANLNENGRKAMIYSVYIIFTSDTYRIIFVSNVCMQTSQHIPG